MSRRAPLAGGPGGRPVSGARAARRGSSPGRRAERLLRASLRRAGTGTRREPRRRRPRSAPPTAGAAAELPRRLGRSRCGGASPRGAERAALEREDVVAAGVDEAEVLVKEVSLGALVPGVEDEPVAALAASLRGTRLQQGPPESQPAVGGIDEEVGNPGFERDPVQPRPQPEAGHAGDDAVLLRDEDGRVVVTEMVDEDGPLARGVLGHLRSA